MIKLKETIVVEGRYDKARLANLFDAPILETGGFGIFRDKERLALLRRLAQGGGIILLTDPDLQPLSVFLSQVNTGDAGLSFAVATVYMVPTLLLFLYGEDYLVEGIAYAGGIKG